MKDVRLSSLPAPRQRLVRLLQGLGFGRIEGLEVKAGQPCLDPMPRVIRRRKNTSSDGPRPQINTGDFAMKREWVEFFRDLDAIGTGTILSIEVAHGLPIIHEFEDVITV